MNKRSNVKKRRRVQIIASLFGVIILTAFILAMSAGEINAKSGSSEPTCKYFTTIYVESGDSLWSIASEYATEEYSDLRIYIEEVMQINDLQGTQLQHGSYLCVPYYSHNPI